MDRITPSFMSPKPFSEANVKLLDIVAAYNVPESPWEQMTMLN
jgi:hypothetical protein